MSHHFGMIDGTLALGAALIGICRLDDGRVEPFRIVRFQDPEFGRAEALVIARLAEDVFAICNVQNRKLF